MRIISNSGNARVVDVVGDLAGQVDLDIVTDEVSLFGAAALFDRVRRTRKLRLLLDGADPALAALAGSTSDRRQRNELKLRALAHRLNGQLSGAELRDSRLPLGQSVIVAKASGDPTLATVGNCPLTTSGLGLSPELSGSPAPPC